MQAARSLEDINRIVQEYISIQELAKQTVKKLQNLDPDAYPLFWESENVEVTFDDFDVFVKLEEYRCGEWESNTITFPIIFMIMTDSDLEVAVTKLRLERERKAREERIRQKERKIREIEAKILFLQETLAKQENDVDNRLIDYLTI